MAERAPPWTPAPNWSSAAWSGEGFSARRVSGLTQILVSGRLDLALAELAPGAVEAGLWSVVSGDPYVVRLARDRALIVWASPTVVLAGWRDEGWAASPTSDATVVFDMEGPRLEDIVAEATSALIGPPSASASLFFVGAPAILYRTAALTARLHVEAALAPYVWQWLRQFSAIRN